MMSCLIRIRSIPILMMAIVVTYLTLAAEPAYADDKPRILPGVYIVEFSTSLTRIRTDNHHELFYQSLPLKTTTVTARFNFSSSVFTGASFHLSNLDEVSTIAAHPSVAALSPVTVFPRPSARVDSHIDISNVQMKTEALASPDTFSPHVMTGVDKLHAQGYNGDGVIIAMIDTGVDYTHPYLGGGFGPGYKVRFGYDLVGDNFTGYNTPIPDPDPMDCNGVGTLAAGVIGADGPLFTGVAPNATLGMYRVVGCVGGASDDVVIAALIRAYESGAHMISSSLGAVSGWTENATSVVVSRIVAAGIPCIFSGGDSGDQGLFYTTEPADGIDSTFVGSVDNVVIPRIILTGDFRVNEDNLTTFQYLSTSAPFPEDEQGLPMYALSFNTSNPADACTELPTTTPSLAGKIVLIRRGTCLFVTKIANAQQYGAKYVMFYDNERPIIPPTSLEGTSDGMVSAAQGAQWINYLANGSNVTLRFFNASQANLTNTVNNITGGTMSKFSSWSPTYEMYIKPEVSAPGGNILSTYPVNLESYAVMSGTELAASFITGVIALYKQAKGIHTFINPHKIRSILATTATPLFFNDGAQTYPFLAPVVQQGGGLVNAFKAVTSTTEISPSNLALNDTTHFHKKHRIIISNTSPRPRVHYKLRHIKVPTVYALAINSSSPQLFPPDFSNQSAEVIIRPRVLTVRKNRRVAVTVEFTRPRGLDAKRIPVYSGYIQIESSEGDTFHVPYAGVGTRMKDVAVTDFQGGYPFISRDNATNATRLSSNDTETFHFPAQPIYIHLRLAMGSALVRVDVLGRGRKTMVAGTKILGSVDGFPQYLQPRNPVYDGLNVVFDSVFAWDGTLSSNKTVDAGYYRLLYRALKIFGNPAHKDDYESWISPRFRVKH